MSQLEKRPRKEQPGERIAKVMARAGLCSRRDAEVWIANGRVSINGKPLTSAAMNVGPKDIVLVDGKPLPEKQLTRVWLYYKPKGLMTTAYDPEGRATVFENLPADMPRVISIGRLDLNSEGLLLLTNDGELARKLELPSTAWIRRYRVRVNGRFDPKLLDGLKDGIAIEGVRYGPIIAAFERQQGANAWLTMALTEGKNREIRRICQHFGWPVSRLIRVGYGPFQLGEMEPGQVQEVKGKQLQTQLRFGNDWRPPEKAEAEETYTARPAFDRGPDRRARAKHAARGGRPEHGRPEHGHPEREDAQARNQRPGRNARLARSDKQGWEKEPARTERPQRAEAPNRAPKAGLKPGWARNKPEKPQPGTRRKPMPARTEGEDFSKRDERPRQQWKPAGGKPGGGRPRGAGGKGDKPRGRSGSGKSGSGNARRFR
ncbi:pseudouridine synthase [Dongia sp.]|uniref:pseudouridine synthase n=1 Tax=Dongia sp. TaxID=1977262 RepID=UPI0035B0D20F